MEACSQAVLTTTIQSDHGFRSRGKSIIVNFVPRHDALFNCEADSHIERHGVKKVKRRLIVDFASLTAPGKSYCINK